MSVQNSQLTQRALSEEAGVPGEPTHHERNKQTAEACKHATCSGLSIILLTEK